MTIQSSLGQTDESFREATLRNVISSDLDDVKYNYQLQFQMHANRVNMAVRAAEVYRKQLEEVAAEADDV